MTMALVGPGRCGAEMKGGNKMGSGVSFPAYLYKGICCWIYITCGLQGEPSVVLGSCTNLCLRKGQDFSLESHKLIVTKGNRLYVIGVCSRGLSTKRALYVWIGGVFWSVWWESCKSCQEAGSTSSSIRMRACLSSALAIHRSCLCPVLRLPPPSESIDSKPSCKYRAPEPWNKTLTNLNESISVQP